MAKLFGTLLATLTAFMALSVSAAQAANVEEAFTGYLVDKSCAAMFKHDHKDPTDRLKAHLKSCDLDPACCEAGYTVYSGGRWVDLDAASSLEAQKVLKASKKAKGHLFKIVGLMHRNEFHTSSIVEVN